MSALVLPQVANAEIEAFQRDGAVVLRNLFAPGMLALLAEGIELSLRRPSRHTVEYVSDEGAGRFFYDTVMIPDSPPFHAFLRDSGIGAAVGAVLQSAKAIAFYASVFVRAPGTAKRTPWHQDMPFWAASGRQTCSTWIPLDPVPRETALEFVRGSHRWPPYARPDFSDRPRGDYLVGERERAAPFPDIEAERGRYEILGWEMDPGDCVFFHGMTAHAGSGDLPPGLGRRAVSFQWLGDDAVFDPKPNGHDPDFADELVARGIKPGDPILCDLCPVVWER